MERSIQGITTSNRKEFHMFFLQTLFGLLIATSLSCYPFGRSANKGNNGEGIPVTELRTNLVLAPSSTPNEINISISPNAPPDIPGGAQDAHLQDAAVFAWQMFIALNWPAESGVRDMPDTTKRLGDTAYSGINGLPLVWHTYRSKVEIFPDSEPNGYINNASQSYGYDSKPEYLYTASVSPGTLQVSADAQPPWINLDEISQISLNKMYAGVLSGVQPGNNTVPQLIRFTPKANRQEYVYIAENQWYGSKTNIASYNNAIHYFRKAIDQKDPVVPKETVVDFPISTIEIKAGWRPLASTEDSSRYYTAKVRFYELSGESDYHYFDEEWALISLHIIVKTPTAPYFIYTTFEQADNILTSAGLAVEDENGNIITSTVNSPTTPGLVYDDNDSLPTLNITGDDYCSEPLNLLYYHNEFLQTGLPSKGNICIDGRYHDIPQTIIDVNKAAHDSIIAYDNNASTSPWLNYKLVNVQWKPFNESDIDTTDLNGDFNPATFYQANIVVETNRTLQKFSGRQIAVTPDSAAGLSTDYPIKSPSPNFKNVYEFGDSTVTTFNMGGCMGCHGNAQVSGNDFSFILKNGPFTEPEGPSTQSANLFNKYK